MENNYKLTIAPPGTGKTESIAANVANALSSNDLANILCVTFTKKAAIEMRARVESKLSSKKSRHEFMIGDLHSVCLKYLYTKHLLNPIFTIISSDEQIDILKQIGVSYNKFGKNDILPDQVLRKAINLTQTRFPDDWKQALWELKDKCKWICDTFMKNEEGDIIQTIAWQSPVLTDLTSFDRAKSDNGLGSTIPYTPHADKETEKRITKFALGYLAFKRQHKLIDFDDILEITYRTRTTSDITDSTYDMIYVDEVQDLNPLQLSVIDTFESGTCTTEYLGDPYQNIFGFNGAVGVMDYIQKSRCPEAHYLDSNYRSASKLVDFYKSYIKHAFGDSSFSALKSKSETSGKVESIKLGSAEEEKSEIRRMAFDNAEKGDTTAILVKNNREAIDLTNYFNSHKDSEKYTVFCHSIPDQLKQPTFLTILDIIRISLDGNDYHAWRRILKNLGFDTNSTYNLLGAIKESYMTPEELLLYKNTILERINGDLCYSLWINGKEGTIQQTEFKIGSPTEGLTSKSMSIDSYKNLSKDLKDIHVFLHGLEQIRLFRRYFCGTRPKEIINALTITNAPLQIPQRDGYIDGGLLSEVMASRILCLYHDTHEDNLKSWNGKKRRSDCLKGHEIDTLIKSLREKLSSYKKATKPKELSDALNRIYTTLTSYDSPFPKIDEWEKVIEYVESIATAFLSDKSYNGCGFLELCRYCLPQLETLTSSDLGVNSKIQIMTIHKSKGAGFDDIIVKGASSTRFKASSPDNEDARLLYVAATRAKKDLIFTHTKKRSELIPNP